MGLLLAVLNHTLQEVETLLAVPDKTVPGDLRNASMVKILHGAGLRVSELIFMKVQDINFDAGFVRIFGKLLSTKRINIENSLLLKLK